MDKLLTLIGEFLAVDVESVQSVEYLNDLQTALKIKTVQDKEILLNLTLIS